MAENTAVARSLAAAFVLLSICGLVVFPVNGFTGSETNFNFVQQTAPSPKPALGTLGRMGFALAGKLRSIGRGIANIATPKEEYQKAREEKGIVALKNCFSTENAQHILRGEGRVISCVDPNALCFAIDPIIEQSSQIGYQNFPFQMSNPYGPSTIDTPYAPWHNENLFSHSQMGNPLAPSPPPQTGSEFSNSQSGYPYNPSQTGYAYYPSKLGYPYSFSKMENLSTHSQTAYPYTAHSPPQMGNPHAQSPTGTPYSHSPAGSPFAPSPAGSPFASSPAGSPFAPSPAGSPFAPSPAGSPFAPSPAGSPFAPSPAGSPFAPSPAGSPFAPSPAGTPYSHSPAGTPFAFSPAGNQYSHWQTSDLFSPSQTGNPYSPTDAFLRQSEKIVQAFHQCRGRVQYDFPKVLQNLVRNQTIDAMINKGLDYKMAVGMAEGAKRLVQLRMNLESVGGTLKYKIVNSLLNVPLLKEVTKSIARKIPKETKVALKNALKNGGQQAQQQVLKSTTTILQELFPDQGQLHKMALSIIASLNNYLYDEPSVASHSHEHPMFYQEGSEFPPPNFVEKSAKVDKLETKSKSATNLSSKTPRRLLSLVQASSKSRSKFISLFPGIPFAMAGVAGKTLVDIIATIAMAAMAYELNAQHDNTHFVYHEYDAPQFTNSGINHFHQNVIPNHDQPHVRADDERFFYQGNKADPNDFDQGQTKYPNHYGFNINPEWEGKSFLSPETRNLYPYI